MKAVLLLLGFAAFLAGLLFAGQGAGIIAWPASSFMLGSTQWVLWGLVIAGIGLVLIGFGARRRS